MVELRKKVQSVGQENSAPTEKPSPKRPDVDLVIEFIMQAEQVAHGKHQKGVVAAVAAQFGEAMYYIEKLEEQRDNLKDAHAKLLKSKTSSAANSAVLCPIPTPLKKYW